MVLVWLMDWPASVSFEMLLPWVLAAKWLFWQETAHFISIIFLILQQGFKGVECAWSFRCTTIGWCSDQQKAVLCHMCKLARMEMVWMVHPEDDNYLCHTVVVVAWWLEWLLLQVLTGCKSWRMSSTHHRGNPTHPGYGLVEDSHADWSSWNFFGHSLLKCEHGSLNPVGVIALV